MIKSPPELVPNALQVAMAEPKGLAVKYIELYSVLDGKGRYLHFDEFRHRLDKGVKADLAWSLVKAARQKRRTYLMGLGDLEERAIAQFFLTPDMQRVISQTDRNTTTAALEWMSGNIGEQKHLEYLLNDLLEDEAISSSQLEGAATTTRAAKELIKKSRKPRTPDEKMIIGNLKMMEFAWENREKDLTPDLICELHKIGVEGIADDTYTPGVFRKSDDVWVQDKDGNVLHQPPSAKNLVGRLEDICEWANTCHDNGDSRQYLHPLIKAIVLHFTIGYEHPFRDGNGRVARALFYWYMFKNSFACFRYISISVLLKNAPVQYGKSYLYTESDGLDLTYFIDYQCSVIMRAIDKFKASYTETARKNEEFSLWLWESGMSKKLSANQKTVFQVARQGVAEYFTANNVKDNIGCSYNTAATILNGLVDLNLFKKEKDGREWVYSMRNTEQIVADWNAKKS